MIAAVRRGITERSLPNPIYVHQATVAAGTTFFAKHSQGSRSIADPDAVLYDAMGLHRGNAMQFLGPQVWLAGLRALARGHLPGKPTNDVRRMPGVFLTEGRDISWSHRARHSAELPDLDAATAT